MPRNTKRVLYGIAAVVCLFWLRNSWTEYQAVGGNVTKVLAAAVFTLLFGLLAFEPTPGQYNDR